jgi:hypothetical protein
MHFGYGTSMVREPEDTDPDSGGGPIRRTVGLTTRSGEGMPPRGWPSMVLRTPHNVVYEPEPGGAAVPGLVYMKFLPDGRLVPSGALGLSGALGYGGGFGADLPDPQAAFDAAIARAQQTLDVIRTWGLLAAGGLAVFLGGAVLGGSGGRLRTAALATGAYVGGVALTRYIVKNAAGSAAATNLVPSTSTSRSGPGHF